MENILLLWRSGHMVLKQHAFKLGAYLKLFHAKIKKNPSFINKKDISWGFDHGLRDAKILKGWNMQIFQKNEIAANSRQATHWIV